MSAFSDTVLKTYYAKNLRSPESITVIRSAKKKKISPITHSCSMPAIRCPLLIRVSPPRIQLVTGKIASIRFTIQPKLRFK